MIVCFGVQYLFEFVSDELQGRFQREGPSLYSLLICNVVLNYLYCSTFIVDMDQFMEATAARGEIVLHLEQ